MEEYETRLKRLRLRSWRRGMKEMDLILGQFADKNLADLSLAQLDAHESLMEEADSDLYAWISGRETPPASHINAVELILNSRQD